MVRVTVGRNIMLCASTRTRRKERQPKYNQQFKALSSFILRNGMFHARSSKGSDDPPCRVIPVSEAFDRIKQVRSQQLQTNIVTTMQRHY